MRGPLTPFSLPAMSLEEGSYTGGKPGQQQLQQHQGGGFGQKGDNGDGGGVNNKVKYTMPGVLHFIQHEWSNFELERAHWEIDRAELQVSHFVVVIQIGRVAELLVTTYPLLKDSKFRP